MFTSNIIGGSPVEEGEYKFIASIRYPEGAILNGADIGGEHLCGGVLVAKNIVLTAGHCLRSSVLKGFPVHINRYMKDGDDHGRFVARKTVEARIHPKYRGNVYTSDFDVALLVLDEETDIEPASILETESCFEYTACVFGTVLGWGQTAAEDEASEADKLQSVLVPIIAQAECQEEYGQMYSSDLISDAMVCAGDVGMDACHKDSGGPMLIKGKVGGIVSWGIGCGGEMPGVYANVPYLADWITTQIADINKVTSAACALQAPG